LVWSKAAVHRRRLGFARRLNHGTGDPYKRSIRHAFEVGSPHDPKPVQFSALEGHRVKTQGETSNEEVRDPPFVDRHAHQRVEELRHF
jgi:hypothetical protein